MSNSHNLKAKRIDSLQTLRTLACVAIFICHTGHGVSWGLGAWGVSVFFVLSGFVLVYSQWNKYPDNKGVRIKDAFLFSVKRIKKLFVLHVIMLLVGFGREIIIGEEHIRQLLIKLAVTIPLLQTWFPTTYRALNSVDWYLSVMVYLYMCFPYVLWGLKKYTPSIKKAKRLILYVFLIQVIIGTLIAFFLPNVDLKWLIYSFPIYRFGDFLVGCLIGYCFLHQNPKVTSNKTKSTVVEILCMIAVVGSYFVYKKLPTRPGQAFCLVSLFIPTSSFLVFYFAVGQGLISRLLTNRVTIFFAGISSYFFLIHLQMLYFVQFALSFINKRIITMFVAFILTVGTSWICYIVYNRKKKRLT